jgi:serine/threonine protein kinase
VFEAVHRETDVHVAIKCLHPKNEKSAEENGLRSVLAACEECKNVIKYKEVLEEKGNVYLVMEFCDWVTLETLVRKRSQLSKIIPESV